MFRLFQSGSQLTVCPPIVFNLIGMLSREWREAATLELSAYAVDGRLCVTVIPGNSLITLGPGD